MVSFTLSMPIFMRKKKTKNLIFGVIFLFAAIRGDLYHSFNFASQADRAPQQLAPITVAPFLTLPTMIHNILATSVWVLFTPQRIMNNEGL